MHAAHHIRMVLFPLAVVLISCDGKEPLTTPDDIDVQLAQSGVQVAAPSILYTRAHLTSIDVIWQDNASNETGFQVEQSTTGATGPFALRGTIAFPGVDAFTDANLRAASQYCHRVRALRTQGGRTVYSNYSNVVCSTTTLPPAPASMTATATSPTQIDLVWSDFAGETRFELERSATGTAGPFILLPANIPSYANSYSDTGLQHGTTYCYRARTFWLTLTGTIYSPYSGVACAHTSGRPAPPSSVIAWPEGSTTVLVGWSHTSGDADGFRIERSTDAVSWQSASTVFSGARSGAVQAAPELATCYRVVALNALSGDSDPSSVSCTTAPRAPSNLTVSAVDSINVRLSWSDNSGVEDGYEVLVRTVAPEGYWEDFVVGVLPPNATGITSNAHWDYLYFTGYYVRAIKDSGYSDNSNLAGLPPQP